MVLKQCQKKNHILGNYDIYFNPKPNDTVRIKYGSLADVKFTIKKWRACIQENYDPMANIKI